MIVNQLSTTSNSQNVNSSQQQQQHMSNSLNLTPQYSGASSGSTMHVSNQNQQQNSQNFLFQTSTMQPQQAQLYHYQLLKTPPPSLATLTNSPSSLAFQTHQYANILPTPDQTNFLSQINFTTKQFDINNNQCSLTASFTNEHQIYEYMHQLLEEKEKLKELYNEPYSFLLPLSAKLLDEEISRVRVNLFQLGSKEGICLPEPVGPPMQLTEKLYVPVKDHPEFNFVGRILGPRGMTAKQLEQETGCKIMVRGKGSMRDKAKEEQMKGKPNWEHLSDELHVLITVEDSKNRAELKLKRAVEEIRKLLVPAPEGEDELKKKQLMELAIINGTYRDGSKIQPKVNQILIPGSAANGSLRSPPNPMGQPLIISPRMTNTVNQTNQLLNGQLIASPDSNGGLIYTTIPTLYSDNAALNAAAQQTLLDYPNSLDFSQAGAIKSQRLSTAGATIRAHPYARVALS